jgi:hypothetical protein
MTKSTKSLKANINKSDVSVQIGKKKKKSRSLTKSNNRSVVKDGVVRNQRGGLTPIPTIRIPIPTINNDRDLQAAIGGQTPSAPIIKDTIRSFRFVKQNEPYILNGAPEFPPSFLQEAQSCAIL